MPYTHQPLMPIDSPWPDTQRHRFGNFEIDISDFGLRNISFRGSRVFDQIFAALRSENWSTFDSVLDFEEIRVSGDTWQFTRCQRSPNQAFTSTAITLNSRDEIFIEYEVEALENLHLNRWGLNFCIATRDWAGARIRLKETEYQLPFAIAPQKIIDGVLQGIFPPSNEMEMMQVDGIQMSMESTGLELEMEDQRNWTDSSFKIYSGSLLDPRPLLLKKGEKKKQSVKIRLAGSPKVSVEPTSKFIEVQIVPLPQIGVQINDRLSDNLGEYSEILHQIGINHVRIDAEHLASSEVNFLEEWGIAVEVALLSSKEISGLPEEVRQLQNQLPPESRILVHADKRRTTSQSELALSASERRSTLVTGTDAYVVDLNRDTKIWGDWVSFSVSPTVHSFDSESIFATLRIQSEAVRFLKGLGVEKVVVSPITFRIRGNPEGDHKSEHRSSTAQQFLDPRLHQLEGAAWTLGSIHALASAGATSGTWHELFGPRGLVYLRQNKIIYSPTFHAISALTINKVRESKLIGKINDSWIAFEFPQYGHLVVASLRPWEQEVEPQHISKYKLRGRLTEDLVKEAELDISWWTQKRFLEINPSASFLLKPFEVCVFTE